MEEGTLLRKADWLLAARGLFGNSCPDCKKPWEKHFYQIFREIISGSELHKNLKKGALPLSEIHNPRVRKAVQESEVVFGFEVSTKAAIPFFGEERMEAVKRGEEKLSGDLAAMCFLYDERTEELELLASEVAALKGGHCYPYAGEAHITGHA